MIDKLRNSQNLKKLGCDCERRSEKMKAEKNEKRKKKMKERKMAKT